MCVGSMCTQPPYNDKIHPVFLFNLLKSYPFLNSSRLSVWRHTDGGPSHDCWLRVALFQHRLHWCLTSDPPWVNCHQMFYRRSRCRQDWLPKRLRCFVVGCNNDHISSHLLGRLRLVLKGNAPSIYLNASMFARIIRDIASPTEEVSTWFFN